MGEMIQADLRGNELPFLILFEIGEEGTPRQIFSNIRHNFSANELASATVQSFEHKKWNPLYFLHCFRYDRVLAEIILKLADEMFPKRQF